MFCVGFILKPKKTFILSLTKPELFVNVSAGDTRKIKWFKNIAIHAHNETHFGFFSFLKDNLFYNNVRIGASEILLVVF